MTGSNTWFSVSRFHRAAFSVRRLLSHAWQTVALFCALGFALAGQLALNAQQGLLGLLCFCVATLLFLRAVPLGQPQPSEPHHANRTAGETSLVESVGLRWLLAAFALGLAFFAYQGFMYNDFRPGWLPWLLAIPAFLLAFVDRPHASRPTLHSRAAWLSLFLLAGIVLLALFFRAYRLAEIPAEMTSDHAEKLLDVQDVLAGDRSIYFPRNTGREALQFYLTAALVAWTPLTLGHLALKTGTVLVGFLTVPFSYLLGREMYGRAVGLLAAFFLAIAHWHVTITRVGLRFPFTAFFVAPALYYLLRALRDNRRNDWLAAGLLLGAGLHSYTTMRIVPLLFALLVGFKLFLDVRNRHALRSPVPEVSALNRDFWINATLSAGTALLFFLPLLRIMRDEPALFWYRVGSRAVREVSVPWYETTRTLLENIWRALLMFNWKGDTVAINTIPEAPALGVVTGALFLLGLAFAFARLVRLRYRQDLYLLVAFGVLLLPSVLSLAFPNENPSVVRAGGAIPLVMIIVALPLAGAGQFLWERRSQGVRAATVITLVMLLLTTVVEEYRWYFVDYDRHTQTSLWNATEMGAVVREFVAEGGELDHVFHMAFPFWVDTRNIAVNAGDIQWQNVVLDPNDVVLHPQLPDSKLYLVYPQDEQARAVLARVYPNGVWHTYDSAREGKDFLYFVVSDGPN